MVETTDERPTSKVARLIDEYGLDGLGAELETRWTADGDERMSLRDLADLFNERLLERALFDADVDGLEAGVERTYENLTSEEVSAGVRVETRNRLELEGVDPEALEQDFVTYQAIRTYLREWRGAEYQHLSDAEKIEKDLANIQRLVTRTTSVTEDRIEKLRDTDRIDLGEFEILFNASVICRECGTQQSVPDLLERRGCECRRES